MFSFTELHGQSPHDKHGGIELNGNHAAGRKPPWLVALKLVVLAGMVAIGAVLLVPALMHWLPAWKAALATAGILLIYIGVAFFVRPQYNPDNMGWFGGMANDPFQYSDNVNRMLFQLHMFLGPGRFAAETLLDACALVAPERHSEPIEEHELPEALANPLARSREPAEAPLPPPSGLAPDRFDPPGGKTSWR